MNLKDIATTLHRATSVSDVTIALTALSTRILSESKVDSEDVPGPVMKTNLSAWYAREEHKICESILTSEGIEIARQILAALVGKRPWPSREDLLDELDISDTELERIQGEVESKMKAVEDQS